MVLPDSKTEVIRSLVVREKQRVRLNHRLYGGTVIRYYNIFVVIKESNSLIILVEPLVQSYFLKLLILNH